MHTQEPSVDTIHLAEELQEHTPDGRPPQPKVIRRERWLIIVVALIVVASGALLLTMGMLPFLAGLAIALLLYFLAGAPVWGAALLRHGDHVHVEEEVRHQEAVAHPEVVREPLPPDHEPPTPPV